jgi:hypothetical protein
LSGPRRGRQFPQLDNRNVTLPVSVANGLPQGTIGRGIPTLADVCIIVRDTGFMEHRDVILLYLTRNVTFEILLNRDETTDLNKWHSACGAVVRAVKTAVLGFCSAMPDSSDNLSSKPILTIISTEDFQRGMVCY